MNRARLEQLREWIPQEVDAVLIKTQVNRAYLSDFSSDAGTLIVTREKSFLIVDGRYVEAAAQTARDCEVRLGNREADWLPRLMA